MKDLVQNMKNYIRTMQYGIHAITWKEPHQYCGTEDNARMQSSMDLQTS
jgi:hypothetical protein